MKDLEQYVNSYLNSDNTTHDKLVLEVALAYTEPKVLPLSAKRFLKGESGAVMSQIRNIQNRTAK